MNLSKNISDLLYRYDCVIIPDFGGFVTNKIGAKIDETTHIFYPPTKQITFNSYLKHNDGLLANYISATENISFEKANILISKEISVWNATLKTKNVDLENIGSLSLNKENQLCFEPKKETNFLIESFGLASVEANSVERGKVVPLVVEENKSIPKYIKYVASVAVLMTFGFVGLNAYNSNQEQRIFAEKQEKIEQKIQQATFLIDNPLPTINLNIKKKETKKYHIIAGAFREEKNAYKKVKQLEQKGFKASIVGKNKWNLIQVAYQSFDDQKQAKKVLKTIKRHTNKEAWMLVEASK